MIRVISFDLYNCLVDLRLDEKIWDLAIPSIYAQENDIPFDEAYRMVSKEYSLHGKDDPRFRSVEFWFSHLKLKTPWVAVFDEVKDQGPGFVFDDAYRILPSLKRRYKIVVFTAEDKAYASHKLQSTRLDQHISSVISTKEFGDKTKTPQSYVWLMKKLGVEPEELVHVGDDIRFDYGIPRQLGIRSFLVDRTGVESGPDVVRSLVEVEMGLLRG